MKKVLIIDDSVLIRSMLKDSLGEYGEPLEIQTAHDGQAGLEKIDLFKPDLITLDVEMPRKTGLEVLKELKDKNHSAPVLMVSTLTKKDASVTLDALSLGASDFLCKPDASMGRDLPVFKAELLAKVKALLQSDSQSALLQPELLKLESSKRLSIPDNFKAKCKNRHLKQQTIIIGASTGGPLALGKLIPKLSSHWDARFVLVQHMPPLYTQQLAERLDKESELKVKEAKNNIILCRNDLYVAPGKFHLVFKNADRLALDEGPPVQSVRPSVDVTLWSAVKHIPGDQLIGIILTGMGRDGCDGMAELVKAGGICIAEDKSTCTIYGMPRAVIEAGLADVTAPLHNIPEILQKIFEPE